MTALIIAVLFVWICILTFIIVNQDKDIADLGIVVRQLSRERIRDHLLKKGEK